MAFIEKNTVITNQKELQRFKSKTDFTLDSLKLGSKILGHIFMQDFENRDFQDKNVAQRYYQNGIEIFLKHF